MHAMRVHPFYLNWFIFLNTFDKIENQNMFIDLNGVFHGFGCSESTAHANDLKFGQITSNICTIRISEYRDDRN